MRVNGLVPERGRVFFTKRAVNQFYHDIGLTMRKGTSCFSKAIKPAEVDSLKEMMTYRLLWWMVKKAVPAELVFQFDETGCSLLPFSKRGRAQGGCSEVKFFGMDDKRQFTLTPVIDGLNKLIFPTQMIWAGTEILKNGDRGQGATPSESVKALHAEHLQHVQTASHWCTIGTIQLLIIAIATHVASVVADNSDLAGEAQHWIVVLDCYAVHIGEEFIAWCKATYPYLILMYIPAACTNWLQPLDISFNGVFKGILRDAAGTWLAEHVAEQLKQVEDPTQVKLDLRLSALKKPFCAWVASALEQMNERPSVIKRGWDESGMGKAMQLAGNKGADCEEFKIACKLHSEGRLFEKFTAKKKAELAEALLHARFTDLMGDEVDAEIMTASRDCSLAAAPAEDAAAPAEDAEAEDTLFIWHDPEYQQMLPTLRMQGTQHQQRLLFSDETQRVNCTQKKQKKK